MADKQPPTVVEGATTGDVGDELPAATNKSAEDRKAASALASLDTTAEESPDANNVDRDAVKKAMKNLPGGGGGSAATTSGAAAAAPARKTAVKVDAADVALLVDQLDTTKPKATELLRAHEGNAVKAMLAYATS